MARPLCPDVLKARVRPLFESCKESFSFCGFRHSWPANLDGAWAQVKKMSDHEASPFAVEMAPLFGKKFVVIFLYA